MTTIHTDVYNRLRGNAGVAALVAQRIYPVELPQEPTLPAITYHMLSDPTEHMLNEATSSFRIASIQVQSWATTWLGAIALSNAVTAAMDGFAGLLGGATGERAWVTQTNAVDLGDDRTGWKRRIINFEVWRTS